MKLPRAEAPALIKAAIARATVGHRVLKRSLLGVALAGGVCMAQDGSGTGRQGLTVQARLGVTETLTDNMDSSSAEKVAGLVTMISPGVRIDSRAGRIRGTLDYALNGILYTGGDAKHQLQQALSAQGVAEVVEGHVFIDAQAGISQQTLSAYGLQTVGSSPNNANRTEVATVSVSPYWRGRLSNWASVEVRANAGATNAKDSIAGDSRNQGASLRLTGLSAGSLQWWSSLNTQTSHFKLGDTDTRSSIANIGLRYRPDVDFEFTISGGPERNNYGGGMRNSSNYGGSAAWTPSVRTKLLADWQHHDYGNAHTFSFYHRMARSVWTYSDTQSVTLGSMNGNAGLTSLYNMLIQQCIAQQGDPSTCPLFVSQYLQANNLDPMTSVSNAFVASTPTSQRLQSLSFALQGRRTSLVASLSQSTSSLLSGSSTGTGDLAQTSQVRQRSVTISVSHQLTPLSSLNSSLSMSQNRSDTAALGNTLRSVVGNWTSRLGVRTTVSLGGRHTRFTGPSAYTENALTANLVQAF